MCPIHNYQHIISYLAAEIRDDEPGVNYTTNGQAGWTPISIRNGFSTRSDEYDLKYLRRCKQIRIYNHEKAC